jgi:methanogenic corrinoid protein MtbC1
MGGDGLRRNALARCDWRANEGGALEGGALANPGPVPLDDGLEGFVTGLLRTVEQQIVPRLVLARRAAAPPDADVPAWAPDQSDVLRFSDIVLTEDIGAACAHVHALRARGASLQSLYLDLLAPTARHLGDLWNADLCDFTAVTLGLWRLQQVLRELSTAFHDEVDQRECGRRVLLAPAPGDQHTFGLFMVAEFFRRDGWEVWCEPLSTSNDMVARLRNRWFAVVGFSVGSEARLDSLAIMIRAIRRASQNRSIGVMVGGPIFVEHPEFAARVGADATAADGSQAVSQARSMLALLGDAR